MAPIAPAGDVTASKLSLPSGPGSIEGLGESFEPQLNTGTYVFSVPFKLTKLRGAVQPDVGLTYNSGGGDGIAGMGWRLSTPFIQRQTDKGLPTYTVNDTIVDSTGEELVKLADGTLRAENESGFVRWEDLGPSGWKATLKNGTVLRFGQTAQARHAHPTLGTFKWLLESAEDLNGNRVAYTYFADAGQVYLSEIEWGLHATQASQTLKMVLGYENGRPDPVVDYRGRFKCQTNKRLATVTLLQGARRIRLWKLAYHPDSFLSLLKSVTVFGDDRAAIDGSAQANIDYLPPITFDYARPEIGAGWQMTTAGPFLSVNFASGEADLVDLNRDGLPDLLYSDNGNYYSALNRGSGQPFGAVQAFNSPVFLPALNTGGVRIADWRGDSKAKVLIPDNGQFYYRDLTSPTSVGPDVDYPVPGTFPLTDPNVQTLDVNSDRALDLVALDVGRFSYVLSSPTGAAPQFQQGPPTPLAGATNFSEGWQFADMNGDRLADLVSIGTTQEGGTLFYPHKGFTEFDAGVTMTGGPGDFDLGSRGKAGLTLVDIDLDGLSDLVMVDSGVVKIWPNHGGLAYGPAIVIAAPALPAWSEGSTAVRFADMNGNGSVDIVWNDPGAGYFLKYLELHPHTKPNQLTSMSNGMGKTLEIEYKSSVDLMLADAAAGQPWTSVPPFPVPVVCAFTERDGMGSTYRTELRYRNGYYDAAEREFRGFETAVRTDAGNAAQGAPSLITEYLFHTGSDVEALKGRPRRVERREAGGAVFDRVSSTWQTRQLPLVTAAGESRRVTFCFAQDETTDVIEKGNGAAVQLFREMEWDNYGNQTRLADYGRVEGANRSAWDDERVVTRTFTAAFPGGLQHWILGLPVEETISDENGMAKAKTQHFYDDETFAGNNPGVVSKGNLTLQRKAVDLAQNQWISSVRNRYDLYGNITHSWDPLGDPANPAAGHFRIFSYDPEFHTWPESEHIELGSTGALPRLTARATYDRGLGVMVTSMDFNGNISEYRYDTFARIQSIIRPGDTAAAPTETYEYRLGMSVSGGRTLNWITASKRETHGGGTLDSRMFFDGLGRKVMTRSEGESPDQTVVTDTVVFNDRRTEWKKYLPYFDTGGLDWKDPGFQSAFVESHYDAAGRVVQAWQPEVDGYRAFARTTYRPLGRLLEDEEQTRPSSPHFGCGMTYTHDGLKNGDGEPRLRLVEEIVKINDAGEPIPSPVAWPTRYAYDILDNLTEIRDSQNNVKPMQYDGLSRLTFMDDPDRGVLSHTYDDASNLTETLDAKGQRIVMTYDGANRLKTEDYFDARGLTPDVTYHYDDAGPVPAGDGTQAVPANLAGKLAWVADLSGAEYSSYDARGRLTGKIKRIPDPANGVLASYQCRYEYDAMDRTTRLHYPDGDWCDYGYNSRGLPETISGGPGGIITGIDYIPTGQMDAVRYGNGVATAYGYDPRLRLKTLVTRNTALNTQLIHFAYTFDAVSNITRIDDNRQHIAPADPRENTQIFSYDSLYRITSAEYPAYVNGTPGNISYRYDRIGNMLSQTSNITATENGLPLTNLGTMGYGGTMGPNGRTGRNGNQPGPHALTAISGGNRSYPYDANGNMENIDGMTCTWDFKDRLIAVENATMRAEYTYDYTDRRITKKVTPKPPATINAEPSTTLYVDRTFELRPGNELTKYVWNGETRVARVTANLHATQRIQRFTLHTGWNILALAVTLSDGDTQLRTGPVDEVARYAPATHDYHRLTGSETVPAGTLLRVHATTAGTLAVRGTWSAPAAVNVPAGRQWLLNTRFAPLELATSLPPNDPLWFWQADTQSWRTRIPLLPAASTHPATLQPGEALFTAAAAPYTISTPDPSLDIRYYHQDHLGSSSVMSDAASQLVSENTFYPFGHPRQEHEPHGVKEAYGFTQKERDGESGLNYFEARYLPSGIGRFTSADPVITSPHLDEFQGRLHTPSRLGAYTYCTNRPLVCVDPSGRDDEPKIDSPTSGLVSITAPLVNTAMASRGQLTPALESKAGKAGVIVDLLSITLTSRGENFEQSCNKAVPKLIGMGVGMKATATCDAAVLAAAGVSEIGSLGSATPTVVVGVTGGMIFCSKMGSEISQAVEASFNNSKEVAGLCSLANSGLQKTAQGITSTRSWASQQIQSAEAALGSFIQSMENWALSQTVGPFGY